MRVTTLPDACTADLVSQRRDHAVSFLASRGLDPGWLARVMHDHMGDGELLLTSSPVRGFANATSDLDFIHIGEHALEGPRIATKIFEKGEHLEVIPFSAAQVHTALAGLRDLASCAIAETVAGYRGWDKRCEPRRKQVERIVNGLTLTWDAPYLEWLPDLGTVWSRAALQNAVEQAAYLALAEAAGELRGRVGYAINTLLQLMDALMSSQGDVCTTRKWCLLRWRRLTSGNTAGSERAAAVVHEVERLRKQVAAVLADPGAVHGMAREYLALVSEVAGVTSAASQVRVRFVTGPGARQVPFLPGASMLVTADQAVLLPGEGLRPADLAERTLAGLVDMGPEQAAPLLQALRANAVQPRVTYGDSTGGADD
ncbi:MAG TPA: DUF6001 family protein [Streptosporangiaceae bacterium]|nr:DUF6001 family protein [Streptosporangiaceae bacterium]